MASNATFRPVRALLAAGLVSTALLPLPALALDGQALLAKINAVQAENGGLKISAAETNVSGNNVVLKNVTFTAPDKAGGPDHSFTLSDVSLTDVKEEADGGYVIGEVTTPSVKTMNEGTELAIGAISISGLVVPADPKAPGLKSLSYYDKANVGPITVTTNGKQYLSIGSVESSMTPAEDGPGVAFETYATAVAITPEPADAAWLTDFGMSSLRGELAVSGSWLAQDGQITLDEVTLTADKLGTLSLYLGLTGMTEQLYGSIKQTSETLKNAGGDDAAQAQAGQLALFGIAQQINVADLSLTFEDDGFTKRALDYAGKSQGISGKQAGDAAKAMVPLLLAQYGIKDPENNITNAIQTFIGNPQNLNIEYAPEKPVPVLQIVSAPLEILNGTDTTVTANEDPE